MCNCDYDHDDNATEEGTGALTLDARYPETRRADGLSDPELRGLHDDGLLDATDAPGFWGETA